MDTKVSQYNVYILHYCVLTFSSTGQELISQLYSFSSNNTTVRFTPYIYNIKTSAYPPTNLGLSTIGPIISNWVQLNRDTIICTVCDNMDNNSANCLSNEYLNPQHFQIQILYRKFNICVILIILYFRSSNNCDQW